MSPFLTIFLPSLLMGGAYALGWRELNQYRTAREIGSDLFVYSRGRLARRLGGILAMAALGATIAVFGIVPPRTPSGAQTYLVVILAEVALMIALPVLDLIETARTARPGKGVSHRDDVARSGRAKQPRGRN